MDAMCPYIKFNTEVLNNIYDIWRNLENPLSNTAASFNFRWSGQSLTSSSRWNSLCEFEASMLHMRSSLATCKDPHTGTPHGTGPDLRYTTASTVQHNVHTVTAVLDNKTCVLFWAYMPKLWDGQCQRCRHNKSNAVEMLCVFHHGVLLRFGVTNGLICQSTTLELHCWMTANMAIQSTRTPWHCPCEVPPPPPAHIYQ